MRLGVFTPTGNNGWIPSETSPQYMPTHQLTRSVLTRAESYGFDFALCMVKLKGFGGTTGFWDYTLETFTAMSAAAAVTEKIKLYCSVGILSFHPAMVARMAATIDDVAPGRFGINIVTGWNRDEYTQMGLWPGDDYYRDRYDYASEYVTILKQLWEDGVSNFQGRWFQLQDCHLGPQPANKIELVAAGSSARGRRFAAEFTDFNFTDASDGVSGLVAANAALAEATAVTGRDVQSLVLRMVILDDTDEAARRRVAYYNDGSDRRAIAYMSGNYALDNASSDASSARFAEEFAALKAIPENGGLLAGSPRTVANALNELARVEGTSGILMSFDDYHGSLDRFGQEVVPLLDFEPTITTGTPAPVAAAFG
jgi:pyrimidine oxygenase